MTINPYHPRPLFSVITVTLNHLNGLQQTHDSLTAQSCEDYEWIVIDGVSHDSTVRYLESTNAKWTSEKDSGIYDAMNKGIKRASGQYLIFMNAGDCFADPDTLATIEKFIAKSQPQFIYGDALEYSGDTAVYKHAKTQDKILEGMITHHQSMLYHRDLLRDTQYDTAYEIAADYDLTLRLLKSDLSAVLYITAPICIFESGGISQRQALKGRIEQFKIRRKNKIFLGKSLYIFMAQSVLYSIRNLCPALYWRLKRS